MKKFNQIQNRKGGEMSKEVRKARQDYERIMLFEGSKAFVSAAYKHALEQVEEKGLMGEEAETALKLFIGDIVVEMWNDVVTKHLTLREYMKKESDELVKESERAKRAEEEREAKAAEESGYRII